MAKEVGGDEALKEIRERYEYAEGEWRDIRDEGRKDMLCAAGKPWEALDEEGAKKRRKAGRPMLALDELSQYVNQLQNDVRATKRGIKVTPTDSDANDDNAEFRQNLIRQIEYKSRAQQVYSTMFDNTVQRSYGFLRVKTKFSVDRIDKPSPNAFDQEIVLEPFENPDMVTPDPHFQRQTLSDMSYCFVREPWRHDEFLRKYPGAKVRSFEESHRSEAGTQWLDSKRVWLGEYWAV
jgi:hypothetical protein